MTEYMTSKQAAAKWGKNISTINVWLRRGLIAGAHQLAGWSWIIPVDAVPPVLERGRTKGTKHGT